MRFAVQRVLINVKTKRQIFFVVVVRYMSRYALYRRYVPLRRLDTSVFGLFSLQCGGLLRDEPPAKAYEPHLPQV